MDLERMKERIKTVTAPGDAAATGRTAGSLNGFIETMKRLDAADLRLLRGSLVFFSIAAVFYVALFILTFLAPPDDHPLAHRTILGLIGLSFTLAGLRIRARVRELSLVDYSEPVLVFLGKVEKRIRFIRREDLAFAIPFSLIFAVAATIGLVLAAERYFPSLNPSIPAAIGATIFAWAGAVAWIRRRNVLRKRDPVLNEAKQLLELLKRTEDGEGQVR